MMGGRKDLEINAIGNATVAGHIFTIRAKMGEIFSYLL